MKKLFANHEISYMCKRENVHILHKPSSTGFFFYEKEEKFSSERLNGSFEEIKQRAEDFAIKKPTVNPVKLSGVKIGHSFTWNL